MSVIGVGRRAGSNFKRCEVRCHHCASSTSVNYTHPDDLARLLADRGWCITEGVIACKAHRHDRMLPRHRPIAIVRARRSA